MSVEWPCGVDSNECIQNPKPLNGNNRRRMVSVIDSVPTFLSTFLGLPREKGRQRPHFHSHPSFVPLLVSQHPLFALGDLKKIKNSLFHTFTVLSSFLRDVHPSSSIAQASSPFSVIPHIFHHVCKECCFLRPGWLHFRPGCRSRLRPMGDRW